MAARRTARPAPTADHLLSAKAPVTVREMFGVPEEEAIALETAKQALARARTLNDGSEAGEARVARAQKAADEARDAVRNAEGVVEVVVRSIGRGAWEKLKEAHPPTEAQKAKLAAQVKEGEEAPVLTFNPDTFPVAALAASCESPKMTVEQAQAIWDSEDWNEEECARLAQMVLQANESRRVANLAF